jgi:hypothetical protein
MLEELKIIMTTVQNVSDGALTIAIIYFVKEFICSVMHYAVVVAFFLVAIKAVRIVVSHTTLSGRIGGLFGHTHMDSYDQSRILSKITKWKMSA